MAWDIPDEIVNNFEKLWWLLFAAECYLAAPDDVANNEYLFNGVEYDNTSNNPKPLVTIGNTKFSFCEIPRMLYVIENAIKNHTIDKIIIYSIGIWFVLMVIVIIILL